MRNLRIPRRSNTFDSLPERTLISGKGRSTPLNRLSERSLVRKIAGSLLSHCDDDLESVRSIGAMSESCATFSCGDSCSTTSDTSSTRAGCFPEDDSCQEHDQFASGPLPLGLSQSLQDQTSALTTPLLHRKELSVDKLLGVGSFSQVFAVSGIKLKKDYDQQAQAVDPCTSLARKQLAKDNKDSKLVVKHLNRRLLQRPKQFFQAALHLEREAIILGQVQHPHIVQLRGAALGGTLALQSGHYNDYFLVLDRLSDTLDERIDQWKYDSSPPSLHVKVTYALQIASALQYLHSRRLIYRDCKPQNIGFLPDGTLQLFDFGFCRSLPSSMMEEEDENEAFHMSLAGTTRYMAPEVLQCDPYNPKADVYSWAMTVYELLTHEKPFGDIKANHFVEYVCYQGARPTLEEKDVGKTLRDAPASLKSVLTNSWEGSVGDRWSMATVVQQLNKVATTLPQDTPIKQRLSKTRQRSSSPMAA